jgi:type II secretory pathway component PulM
VYPKAACGHDCPLSVAANERADRWQARHDEASSRLAKLEKLARDLLTIHNEVVMDTPKDRALHAEVVATFNAALDVVTR